MVLYKRNDNYKTGKAIKTTSLISSKKEVCVVFSSKKNSRVFFLLQVRNLRDIDRLYSAIFYLFYLWFGAILHFLLLFYLHVTGTGLVPTASMNLISSIMTSSSSLHIFPVYLHTQVSHCTTHRTINARLTTSQLQAFHALSDPTSTK